VPIRRFDRGGKGGIAERLSNYTLDDWAFEGGRWLFGKAWWSSSNGHPVGRHFLDYPSESSTQDQFELLLRDRSDSSTERSLVRGAILALKCRFIVVIAFPEWDKMFEFKVNERIVVVC
jgi:hypothetical protein